MMMENDAAMIASCEAVLFAAGEPFSIKELAKVLDCSEEQTLTYLRKLQLRYEEDEASALSLKRVDEQWLLTVKDSQDEILKRYFRPGHMPSLSPASYECLAAILYNQPATRAQVEEVRGVNSDGVISRLEERGLIEECGVLEQPGRPSVYQVTKRFLLEAGLESAEDLPPQDLLMYESIRIAEGEVK